MKKTVKMALAIALGALVLAACQNKEEKPLEKPVVTAEMFSVSADSQAGVVNFKFTADGLSPYWTVVDPKGIKSTFTDRETTKTYEVNGDYSGTIIAFGDGGQSDPVEFTFSISVPVDPTLSQTEMFLMANSWKPYHYGYCADPTVDWWDWEAGPVPGNSADDILTYGKDGIFTLNLGNDILVFNDQKGGKTNFTMTGNEKWAYVKDGEVEYIQFSNGGFPAMLGDDNGVNARYEIRNIEGQSYRLYYHQPDVAQYFYITFVPEDYVEPSVTVDEAVAAISGKTFYVSAFGWWAEGWAYFDDPVWEITLDDTITFNADGALVIDLGSTPTIYNDNASEGEAWTVTGNETWSVGSEENSTVVKFANGGFPLMLGGAHVDASDPTYHHGLNASWTINSIEDGTVRLEIYQDFNSQWFTVFLTPVE